MAATETHGKSQQSAIRGNRNSLRHFEPKVRLGARGGDDRRRNGSGKYLSMLPV